MSRFTVAALVMLASCLAAGATAGETRPKEPRTRLDRFKPLILETDDLRTIRKVEKTADGDAAKPAAKIQVDAKTRTVRIPVAPTRTRGAVEWLLTVCGKHPATSVLVTARAAAEVSAAFAKAGFEAGVHPRRVGADRVRPPSGRVLEIHLIFKTAGGKEKRIPAARLLASKSDGTPLGAGRWVYVGPQRIGDGTDSILLTELSGSLATTNVRDASAIVYWVPEDRDPEPYVRACYASREALPGKDATFELEIRAAKRGGSPEGCRAAGWAGARWARLSTAQAAGQTQNRGSDRGVGSRCRFQRRPLGRLLFQLSVTESERRVSH